jgi:cyclopropane-fatty-acyl-phospholipid synthase
MKKTIKHIAQSMHRTDPDACFAFEFWDGDGVCFGDTPRVTLRMKSKTCLYNIIKKGFLGFGESYMKGDIEIEDDLSELFRLGFAIGFDDYKLPFWRHLQCIISELAARGSRRHAAENIAYHYDRSNEFYALYLDDTMTYSCAYFQTPDDSLGQAQFNKYDHICRKLLLKPDETLLDIGCGWGGMLIFAAQRYGVSGVGITLSKNQFTYANDNIRELGLQDRVQVLYKDYRELSGNFDKVVSIGMFEHVGKKYIPTFMQKITGLLKAGGLGLLHTIGKNTPSAGSPWTFKYIFPGGYLPALHEIISAMGNAGFFILDVENLRLHYAKTLEKWTENYEKNAEKIRELFDETFVKQWRLFLYSSAAGFKYGNSQLFQILFSNGPNNALPITRSHVYDANNSEQ